MELRVTEAGNAVIKVSAFSEGIKYDDVKGVGEIFDFFEDLDVEIDYHGVKVSPTVIVKIYCKLNHLQRLSIQKNKALIAAQEGSPILW